MNTKIILPSVVFDTLVDGIVVVVTNCTKDICDIVNTNTSGYALNISYETTAWKLVNINTIIFREKISVLLSDKKCKDKYLLSPLTLFLKLVYEVLYQHICNLVDLQMSKTLFSRPLTSQNY